jgi:two-component system nitrate/nitrite response regulator NarL
VVRLTKRQREIVEGVLDGCSNGQIASRFGTREQTVKNQLTVIFHKTGVSSRLELAILALQTNLLDSDR